MCKKFICVVLSLLIIVLTCVVSYEEAYANPFLLLVELVSEGLGISTAATTGLVASMNYAAGRKVILDNKKSNNYANNFLGKLANTFGYAKSYMQLFYAAEDVKLQGMKDMAGYLVNQIKDKMKFAFSGNSYSYVATNEVLDTSKGNNNEYLSEKSTITTFNDSFSQKTLGDMGVSDTKNKTLVPADSLFYKLVKINHEGGNIKTLYSDSYHQYIANLDDGIYRLGIDDVSGIERWDMVFINYTVAGKHDATHGICDTHNLWFRIFTQNGDKYITYNGQQATKVDAFPQIIWEVEFYPHPNNFIVRNPFEIDTSVTLNRYDVADVEGTDYYVPVGKTVSVPTTASYSNVTNSTTKSKVDSTTGSVSLDVPSINTVPDTDTPSTDADQKTFMSTVTGFISSYWTKFPLALNDFTATITESLGGTITGESQRMRETLQEELQKERQSIKTSADSISGAITAEGDAVRKYLEQEAERDRATTGAIAGSVDGVQDRVDSLTDSVDSIKDKLDETTSTDGDINWAPLKVTGVLFTTKFPFSLPWDILKTFQALLIDSPKQPSWDVRWHDSVLNRDFGFTIDVSKYDSYFKFAKVFVLIGLNIGMIMITRKLLGGAT